MYALFSLRLRIIYGVVILFALIFTGKLFFLQVTQSDEYKDRAENQYTTPVAHLFDRGSILFSHGVFSAATLKSGYTVAINPSLLTSAQETFSALKEVLPDLDSDAFFLQAGKINDPYEEIARRVTEEKAQKIKEKNIRGVSVLRERWRYYPGEKQAAHTIGFVGFDGDRIHGRYGLERYYEDVLFRGQSANVNLFAETFANIKNSLLYEGETTGAGNLTLTLDYEVQLFLEKTLEAIIEKWSASGGGAIVMHPKTGALYALAAEPSFDPNNFSTVKDFSVFSNPIVENVYEMGSIMKPITLASALDAGVMESTDTYYDGGTIILNNKTISNYDGKARGRVSVQEILNQSLNVGAVHVAQKLGNKRFSDYFSSFGFEDITGIDLPNEATGLVENIKSGRDVEIATASFGQGFAVTPITMVRALAALGNGGFLVRPFVVERIDYENHLRPFIQKPEIKEERVISSNASEEITRMLVKVVDEALLGGTVKMPHYSIAAKTGTAQIARKDGKGYYDDRFLHSFFGYFPAFDPKFIILFYIVEPKGVRFASETLTSPFMETVSFLTNYYNVPPDR